MLLMDNSSFFISLASTQHDLIYSPSSTVAMSLHYIGDSLTLIAVYDTALFFQVYTPITTSKCR